MTAPVLAENLNAELSGCSQILDYLTKSLPVYIGYLSPNSRDEGKTLADTSEKIFAICRITRDGTDDTKIEKIEWTTGRNGEIEFGTAWDNRAAADYK